MTLNQPMPMPTQSTADQVIRPVTDREFALFQKLIYSKAGIHLAPAKKALLEARLTRRLRDLGPKFVHGVLPTDPSRRRQ